jgi:hypothetical protein
MSGTIATLKLFHSESKQCVSQRHPQAIATSSNLFQRFNYASRDLEFQFFEGIAAFSSRAQYQ